MSKYWNELTRSLDPYVPGEQPKDKEYIKLNANESAYAPSPKVLEAIKRAANEDLRMYPDANCYELRDTIAQYYGLKREQIFVGNGSDELLAFSFMAFFTQGKPILYPDITYSFYPVYSKLFKIDYKLIPLDEEFNIPVDPFLSENGGVIISNPNAPTAKDMPLESIQKILKYNLDKVVLVDEAYIDFGGESAVKLIDQYPNLLVMQTFSKSRCLAGLRVGFVMGQKDLIEGINRIKNSINSYTLDRAALAGAVEAIKDETYFQENRKRIIKTRERISKSLREIGFKVTDSKANFIFISHSSINADKIFAELKGKGILVRYFKIPRIDNFLRIGIGTDEEMDIFMKAIKEIV